MQKFPITVEGFKKISEALKKLKTIDRPEIIKAIASARELGDLSENAEYHAAREKQGFIECKISEIEDKIARSEVIDTTKLTNDTIKFGAKVQIENIDTNEKKEYRIVGESEADIKQNMISIASPIAKALIGKQKGELIEVTTPGGVIGYEVLEISY